jgi:GR25 family glycosyltransferase involved in LPS biosynthesis
MSNEKLFCNDFSYNKLLFNNSVIDNYVDKIFIINLKSRQDRWNNIAKQLNILKINNYERFDAICPTYNHDIQDSDIINFFNEKGKKKVNLLNNYNYETYNNITFNYFNNFPNENKINMIKGIVGCKASHVEIIKIAKERKYKKILILEDDAVFCQDFEIKLDNLLKNINNIDYDLLYLGINNQQKYEQINDVIGKVKYGTSTVCYCVTEKNYDFIINNAMISGQEIDNFYMDYLQKNNNCYCSIPNLVTQSHGYSDIESRNL